eukprot:3289305-Pyramimonas_sp.AAC.1
MDTIVHEVRSGSIEGLQVMKAIARVTDKHVKGDASAARTRWKEFVDESLAGGGRGAHAISKK